MGDLDVIHEPQTPARILRRVDEILHHDMALQEALDLILKVLAEGVGADSSSLLMLARGREEFVIAASFGLPREVARSARIKLRDRSVSAWVLKNGKSLRLQGRLRDARFEGTGPHIASSIIVPVYLAGECLGVLSVSNRSPGRQFTERDLRLLEGIGSHIAVLVERLRLERRLFKSLEATRILNEAATRLSASRDLPSLFGIVSEALPRLMGIECRAALFLDPPDTALGELAGNLGEKSLRELEALPERLGRRALREGRPFCAFEMDPEQAWGPWSLKHGLVSGLALPLLGQYRALGALEIYTRVPYRFPPEEIWVLDNLAHLAAVAIENIRLTQSLKTEQTKSIQHEKLATLGQLAAGIAHEIQNPLSGIIGYTQLLKKSLEEHPGLQEDLAHIERETDRLRRLAQSMMGCARPEQREPVSLHEVLDMALGILHFETKRHGAKIYKEYDPLPPFPCDPGQLEQAFINLILNALQSLEGRPERRVRVKTLFRAETRTLEIELSDTGCGIRPEDLPRLFEPYFTTGKGGAGNGLGLSTVKGVVERHGGTIQVQSEVSAGTTVRLSFPCP